MAIEPEYLLEIRNSTTQMLEGDIPTIFAWFFKTYGSLNSRNFTAKQ